MTVVGRLDARTVSSSAEFKSFLLSMCIAAPNSTTNTLSSGLNFGRRPHAPAKRRRTWPRFAMSQCFSASPSFLCLFLRACVEFESEETPPIRMRWPNPPTLRWRVRTTTLFTDLEWVSLVGARPERRRETPRSTSRAAPASIPQQETVELLSHANGGVGGSGVSH